MTEALTPDSVAAVDSLQMLADICAQPAQLSDALWRVEAAAIEPRDLAGGLVFCGMGGSAVGGDLARAVIGQRARREIRTVRDYALEPWVDQNTLVACASYSGNTEETLACFEDAGAAGCPRVVITTGGALASAARSERVPVIGVPAGLQPRAAVCYMIVAALECAAVCGAAPRLTEEINAASELLGSLVTAWGPGASDDSPAKALARRLEGTIPVVYGAELTTPAAMRWKTQINENAKSCAFYSELPEADHNELCGWQDICTRASLFAVFLADRDMTPRLLQRVEMTADFVKPSAAGVQIVESVGETALERLLSLVLLGDLVSVYLAVLQGTDPGPVEAIERFKTELA